MATAEHITGHEHHGGRRMDVVVHVTGYAVQEFQIGSDAHLLDVMEKAAKDAGVGLLPPKQRPFDHLHAMVGETVGPVIEDLDKSLSDYLRHPGHTAHFTIELARAIRVNKEWDVATKEEMSPREILALPRIDLDYTKFTLYLPESIKELPLDTPIKIIRGMDLEAQSDGKYGGGL